MSQIPQGLLDEMTPAVRAFVETLLAENAALRSRVEKLERRLGMNSGIRLCLRRVTGQSRPR